MTTRLVFLNDEYALPAKIRLEALHVAFSARMPESQWVGSELHFDAMEMNSIPDEVWVQWLKRFAISAELRDDRCRWSMPLEEVEDISRFWDALNVDLAA